MGNLKITVDVSITVNVTAELLKNLARLQGTDVLVGIPAEKALRPDTHHATTDHEDQMNNATLLYIHNYGSPAANIPARPVMEPGIEDAREKDVKLLTAAGQAALAGRDPRPQLEAVGLVTQNAIKRRITSNTPPPLAPSTLAARKRRGVSRTNTLVDEGKMLNAVSYVIRKKVK